MKETKACDTANCDRTLPASSKHTHCSRCRAYDRRWADKRPVEVIERFENVSRWSHLLTEFLPKKERNVRVIHSPAPVTKIDAARKRA